MFLSAIPNPFSLSPTILTASVVFWLGHCLAVTSVSNWYV